MGEAFESMKQGLTEAIEHVAGKPSTAIVHKPQPINVKAIRKQVGMTQTEFAASFGISLSTLRHWERGDRTPRGPAVVLLRVVAKAPRAVLDALETFGCREQPPAPDTEDDFGYRETDGGGLRASASPNHGMQPTRNKPRAADA
jgi:putative transcriptional regulator